MNKLTLKQASYLVGIVVLGLYPLMYWGYFAGDAEIHLIFGKNAALGHFFEFNWGEKSSGESSVGYMLFLGLLFRLFSASFVPAVIKLVNYITWLLFLFVFYRLLKYKKFNKNTIIISLLIFGLLPGSVYNSMVGMENGIFGLFSLTWFYLAIKHSYFEINATLERKHLLIETFFGLMMGIGVWMRPEALPFFLIAVGVRFLSYLIYKKSLSSVIIKSFVTLLAFSIPVILMYSFIYLQTGQGTQSSVVTRILWGRMESHYHWGIFLFDSKILTHFLLAYFPITVFWLCGAIIFFNKNWQERVDEFFAITVFFVFLTIFTFITGAYHLGRYAIFLTPYFVLIAALGFENLSSILLSRKFYQMILGLFLIALISAYTIESIERLSLGDNRDLSVTMNSPCYIKKNSDLLIEKLGNPKKLPVTIAVGEIEMRYRIDNRFIVRSFDGRVDSALLKYIHKGSVDYIGYLKERNVEYLISDYLMPSFNNTLPIEKLQNLKTHEYFLSQGLKFTNLGHLSILIDYCPHQFLKITPV